MIIKCAVSVVFLGLAVRFVLSQIDGYIPGEDYPIYSEVPQGLSFKCENRLPGYYSDPEAQCQVWHWCLPSGQQFSFLCPNGTIFNQFVRVCDWWFNVDCAATPNLYNINEDLYKVTPYQQRTRRHSTRVLDDLEMVASYNFQPQQQKPQQPQPFQQQQGVGGRRQSALPLIVVQNSNDKIFNLNRQRRGRSSPQQQQQSVVRGRRQSSMVVQQEAGVAKGIDDNLQRVGRRRQPVNLRN